MEKRRRAAVVGTVEEMADDVVPYIGQTRYDAIKRRDDHPMFLKLTVAYEGFSHGAITVQGKTVNQAKRWYRAAVDELADALNFGSPGLFEGHEKKDSRPRLGEILGSFAEDVDGKRTARSIAYVADADVRPRIKAGELPKCSVEADILIADLETDEPFVQAVDKATAVVLASSDKVAGFSEAGVEAVIAELKAEGSIDEMNKDDIGDKKPSELFSRNILLEDSVVKDLIAAGRENVYAELKTAKTKVETLEAEAKVKDDKITSLNQTLKDAGTSANAGRIGKVLGEKIGALKLNKDEKALIETRLKASVKIDDPEATDESVAETVEAAVKAAETDALAFRKLYGGKAGSDDDAGADEKTGEDEAGSGEEDDFLAANKLKSDDKRLETAAS